MSAGMPDAISMLQYAANSRAEEEKHLLRKERNRQSAAVSRKRQRDHRQQLEEENARLRDENEQLLRLLHEHAPHVELPRSAPAAPSPDLPSALDDEDCSSTAPRPLLPMPSNAQPAAAHQPATQPAESPPQPAVVGEEQQQVDTAQNPIAGCYSSQYQ